MPKLLACIFMIVDHSAFLFLDHSTYIYWLCRLIGRLAMPIFAYNVAMGYMYTSDLKKYISRMIIMTLFAQFPLSFMVYGNRLFDMILSSNGFILLYSWNIGLTFTCALLILFLIRKIHLCDELFQKLTFISLIALLLLIGSFGDYGIYGISLVMIFYYLRNRSYLIQSVFISISTFLYYLLNSYNADLKTVLSRCVLQLFCVLSLVVIKYFKHHKTNLSKSFFYWFYPFHMLILSIIKYF